MLRINYTCKSPNFADEKIKPKYIVLHCMCMADKSALDLLCSKEKGVSAHYYIARDGQIYNLVAENKKAWHAGNSKWKDTEWLNVNSIGIELGNNGTYIPGLWGGETSYNDIQYQALIALLKHLKQKYRIPSKNILAHSDISPERKTDPGMHFDWHRLIEKRLAINFTAKTTDCRQALKDFGYNLDYNNSSVISSFQRRFLPHNITGKLDKATKAFIRSKVKVK